MRRACVTLVLLALCALSATGLTRRNRLFLWKGVPGMEGEQTLLEAYFPERPNGTAVIICPGGSYHHLGVSGEGRTTARWFSSLGVTAFVLMYRTAHDGYHYPAMMQDVQRALQVVREQAGGWGIEQDKVGLIGYSAGGHLVAWAAEYGATRDELLPLGITTLVSLAPSFVVPVYPVVTMQDEQAHRWSRKSLLGRAPDMAQKQAFSLELNVPGDMPPTYLVACRDDPVVTFENSQMLYDALVAAGADVTFAQYPDGGHGFGMKNTAFMRKTRWNEALAAWLTARGFL